MYQHRQGNLSDFQDHKEINSPDHSRAGDHRVLNRKFKKSGKVIQDRQDHVKIHQYFGGLKADFIISNWAENSYIEYYEPGTILIPDAPVLPGVLHGVRWAMLT